MTIGKNLWAEFHFFFFLVIPLNISSITKWFQKGLLSQLNFHLFEMQQYKMVEGIFRS